MRKLNLCVAGIALLVAIPPATSAATDAERLKQAQELFQPLPPDMATPDSPTTPRACRAGPEAARMTIDSNVSCASCHQPARYGTDGLAKAMGVKERPHPRNAPTIMRGSISSFTGEATAKVSRIK
jgi:cytochrome c peroxidase